MEKEGNLFQEKVVILTEVYEFPGSESTSCPGNYIVYKNKAANVKSSHFVTDWIAGKNICLTSSKLLFKL